MFRLLGYIVIFIIAVVVSESSENICNATGNDNSRFEDYYSLYNTSLSLYLACSKRADQFSELYDEEHIISDMFMHKLEECESDTKNLTNSINYTSLAMIKRENIEFETDLLNAQKQREACEEKRNIGLNLISDYKNKVTLLNGNLSTQINSNYILEGELKQCHKDLNAVEKLKGVMFENLNSCLEREEILRDQKNRYVLRLSKCRKNREKLKAPSPNH